jgi:hypothetical protein
VRAFIDDSLYHPTHGYFTSQQPVGFLDRPIDFGALSGQRAYLAEVLARYRELRVAWLTPAEIFSPHYGAAFAAYLARAPPPPGGLRLYEIGGGTGTFARDLLGWLRAARPEAYAACRYTCLEISPALAAVQRRRVAGEAGHAAAQFEVRVGDASDPGAWGPASGEECHVMMMEVLDNMPHDRAWREAPGEAWRQTMVAARRRAPGAGPPRPEEVLAPAEDPLLLRCLQAWEEGERARRGGGGGVRAALAAALRRAMGGAGAGEAVFLPTGALKLFDTLHRARPNHRLVAADFDALPETVIDGANAPLVATTRGGATRDHDTYLVPPGAADIFFPSCFDLLCRLYGESRERAGGGGGGGGAGSGAAWMKTRQFVEAWAPHAAAAAATRDGYNPLLEDYSNTAVLLS